jgi:O-antigen ligase
MICGNAEIGRRARSPVRRKCQWGMQLSYDKRTLTGWLAAAVTVSAFAKTFVPFYLIGSTAIFVGATALAVALAAVGWRRLRDDATHIPGVLFALALLYGVTVANFLSYSLPAVPITHLAGILIFHAIFLLFGFAAARATRMVLKVLLAGAAVYVLILVQHTVRFGDVMRDNHINDVFGVGNPTMYNTFHQNIGLGLGLGLLAAFGLASNRIRLAIVCVALPILLFFLFHIGARTALLALVGSLLFLAFAACWVHSKRAASLAVVAAIAAIAIASAVLIRYAMQDRAVDPAANDAISRTIRELQDTDPQFRMQIWSRTLHHIVSEPQLLLFGRGIGMFPVNEGFGPPDWFLRPTEGSKHYPHNIYLDILYESGLAGLLPFVFLTLFPLIAALRRWRSLSAAEQSVLSTYVFVLLSAQLSGAFARSNIEIFFLALATGIIAAQRADEGGTSSRPAPV